MKQRLNEQNIEWTCVDNPGGGGFTPIVTCTVYTMRVRKKFIESVPFHG